MFLWNSAHNCFIPYFPTAEHRLEMTLFAPPTQTTLHYRIVTPMFLGGENQEADAMQFRNASFKGALRFWWRALNWGRCLQAEPQPMAALKELHKREGDLFGLASDGKNSRQSQVQIHSDLQGAALKQPGMTLKGVSYLLGQGLFHYEKGVTRQYLEGGNLTIRLNFKPGMAEADIQSVEQAAIALGLFGGLGIRHHPDVAGPAGPGVAPSHSGQRRYPRDVVAAGSQPATAERPRPGPTRTDANAQLPPGGADGFVPAARRTTVANPGPGAAAATALGR